MAAKFEVSGFNEYFEKLEKLGIDAEKIAKVGLYEGAGIVADEVKASVPVKTGDLRDAMRIQRMVSEEGVVSTTIDFPGYDRNGVPNQLKANMIESGTSTEGKTPFVRPAFNRAKEKARRAIIERCEAEITKKLEDSSNG